MENLVLRYIHNRNRNEYIRKFIKSDGSVTYYIENSYSKDLCKKDADKMQKETDDAITSKYLLKSYPEFIKKIKEESSVRVPKLYENYIVGDYLVVMKEELNFSSKIFFSFKLDNEKIKETFFTLLGNSNHRFTSSSCKNNFNWIACPEAIDVMLSAAMLDSNGIEKFAKRQKKKKNGKVRIYYAPNDEIKRPLQELNKVLQYAYDDKNKDFQIAYKKGKSVYDNAKIHEDKKYVFNIDLKDFYPSCKRELVRKYIDFLFFGTPNKKYSIEKFLDIILIDDGLFIGNPISGCLANTILNKAVLYMKNICQSKGMNFSVYADDISFSSDRFISEKYITSIFNKGFAEYGLDGYFKLNTEKSVGYSGCNRKVTGVSINGDNKITVSRKYYRTLRTMIAHLAKGDSNIDVNKLRGKIAYATMIDDSGKIYNYLMKFKETVKEHSLCSNEKLEELKNKFERRD